MQRSPSRKSAARVRRASPTVVNVAAAKACLSELIARAAAGEDIILARAGGPRARLVPLIDDRKALRVPGKRLLTIPPDFDAPLADDVLELFYGPPP